MKKTIFLTLILTLLLAACGGTAETVPSAGSAETAPNTDSSSETVQDGENSPSFDIGSQELPLSSALAIGTLKLEETTQAVAPDQAADLLPLWQVLNSLTTSDTAAPEEIEAILEQIQETMTDEQMAAIEAMELTGEDMFATIQELGIEFGSSEGLPEGAGTGQGPGGGGFPGGGPPGGGPGGSPGDGFGGSELSPEQIATAQARRAEGGGGFGNRLMTPLVEAVIDLLELKAQ
jgi:hypothetical protein